MSSPVVGSARVEILGDLDAFARSTVEQTDAAMGRMREAVSTGLNEITTVSGTDGARAGEAYANGLREKLSTGMRSADESATNDLRSVSERTAAEGRLAGEKFGAGIAEGVRATAPEVEASAAREGEESESLFARYGRRAGERFNESAREGVRGIGTSMIAGFGAVGLGELGKSALEQADTLEKANIKIEHAFGESGKSVEAWAGTLSSKLGLSRVDAENLAGTFDRLLSPMHLGSDQAAKMSEHFTELAQNIAAANGADPAKVSTALISGLRGRATALRQYGIDLNTTTLAQYAADKGIVKTQVDMSKVKLAQDAYRAAVKNYAAVQKDATATELDRKTALDKVKAAQSAVSVATAGTIPPLTDAQKTQAAYGLILRQTGSYQGAFAEHSSTLAERQRIVTAEFHNAEGEIGTKMMPVLATLAGYLLHDVIPALAGTGHWIAQNKEWLVPLAIALAGAAVAYKAVSAAQSIWNTATTAGRAVMGLFTGSTVVATAAEEARAAALAAGATAAEADAAATEAATVAQTELDAAMDANPIGLVVAAIAALAVGLIYAWKHSETFRTIVTAAFGVVKTAGVAIWHVLEAAWNSVGKPLFTVIIAVVKWFIGLWKSEIGVAVSIFRTAWNVARAIYDNVIKPLFQMIVTVVKWFVGLWRSEIALVVAIFRGAWDVARGIYDSVIQPLFGLIVDAIKLVWTVAKFQFGLLRAGFSAVWTAIKTVAGWIGAAFHGIGTVLAWVWNNVIKRVFGWIGSGIHGVSSVVSKVVGVIESAWRGLGTVLQWVYDHTIGPLISSIESAFHGLSDAVTSVTNGINSLLGRSGEISSGVGQLKNGMYTVGAGAGHHAHGGTATGRFIVGEEGPEILDVGPMRGSVSPAPLARQELQRSAQRDAGGLSDADRELLLAVANRPVYVQLGSTTLVKATLSTLVSDGDRINARRSGVAA